MYHLHMVLIDETVRNEYISSKISLRKLAEKYGIAFSTIQKAARREGWNDMRSQVEAKSNQITIERCADQRSRNSEKAALIMQEIIDKLLEAAKMLTPSDVQAARQIIATMKDLKEIGAFAVDVTDESGISVSFEEEVEEYGI